jgi:PAS domain-containing protein
VSEKAAALNAASATLEEWPRTGSTLEDTLFASAIVVFTSSEQCEHCQAALRRLLGETTYGQLVAFLAYVKTCHSWVESFPELSYEAGERAREQLGPLLSEEPRLAEFFTTYPERLKREAGVEKARLVGVTNTEQRHERAEAALREAEERFRKVFEEGPIAMAMVGPDLRFIKPNGAFCHLFGYSEDELRQLTFRRHHPSRRCRSRSATRQEDLYRRDPELPDRETLRDQGTGGDLGQPHRGSRPRP